MKKSSSQFNWSEKLVITSLRKSLKYVFIAENAKQLENLNENKMLLLVG